MLQLLLIINSSLFVLLNREKISRLDYTYISKYACVVCIE